MSLLKKADHETRSQPGPRVLTDPGFAKKHPLLWSYLTQTAWEDGTARLTSSLLIFSDDGTLKGMLRDREAGLCLWVAGATFGGLLEALEGSLGDPRADWRQDRQQAGQTAKRQAKRG